MPNDQLLIVDESSTHIIYKSTKCSALMLIYIYNVGTINNEVN